MRTPRSRILSDLLDEMAARHARRPAIIADDRQVSFREWARLSETVAAGLARLGAARGDHVALLATNSPEWLYVAFGILRLGAVVAAFSTWSRSWDLEYELRHSEASILVLLDRFRNRDFLADLKALVPEIETAAPGGWRSERFPRLRHVVVIGLSAPRGAMTLDQLIAVGADAPPPPTAPGLGPSAGDTAYLLYTSGSTARPKAVRLIHYSLIENGFNIGERVGVRPQDRVWVPVPLFWSYGAANATMASLTHGAAMVLQESFEAGRALDLIERSRCTVAYTLPNITLALIEHPAFRPARTASLRTGLTIGSPEDLRLAMKGLGASRMCSIYGATEVYGNCCVTPHTDEEALRLTTQGPPLPGVTLKVADPETGEALPPGEVGELWVKGYVTPGYFKPSEEDAAALTPDGFFRAGDLGLVGTDGRLRFRGRFKEMIKTGGINVSPQEVEDFLNTHPAVRQAAVVGVPHPAKGEIVAAFIRSVPGESPEADELQRWCKERIAGFKVPALIAFLEELPMTDTGKLFRRRLRELGVELLARQQQERRGV
ncbi:MAG: AMP-binding protein [bacterium]